jgi:iron complex outermembrane receptor protein
MIDKNVKATLIVGVGLCTLALPVPFVFAQDSSTNAAARNAMEEIVVSAQRRDEMQQSVPAAITAISGSDIESKRIQTGQDLQMFVPSLSISTNGSRDGNIYNLRGQGTTLSAGPGVVVYFNEVPLPFNNTTATNGGGPGLYFDLQNLQVLKGPQGTLFGRNTTGGAILLQPNEPTNKLEGFVDVGGGNYNDREYQGVLNIPVVDNKLLVRIAGSKQTRDGYTKNTLNDDDLDNRDNWAYRTSVSLRPIDELQSDFLYYNNHYESNGSGIQLTATSPFNLISILYGPSALPKAFADQQARGIRQTATDAPSAVKNSTWGIINITRWDISDSLALRNIASYQDLKSSEIADGDGTALPIIASRVITHSANSTEELQLQGNSFNERLDWTTGGYLEYVHPKGEQHLFTEAFGNTFAQFIQDAETGLTQRSKALYAQGTYDLGGWAEMLDGLKLTGGYRYTWDTRKDTIATTIVNSDSSAGTWTLGLDYQLAPETLIYLKTSRGYKAGGANTNSNDPSRLTFTPEYVRDMEGGLKRDWNINGLRARTNFALFHTDYTDIQRTVPTFFQGHPGTATANAARAKIDGFEFEGTVQPATDFAFSASYSYLNARYEKSSDGFDKNLPFSFAPKNKITASATYYLPVSKNVGDISMVATYSYISSTFGSSTTRQLGDTINGYGLVNLRADWSGIYGSQLDASLFMTNAANKVYIASNANTFYNFVGFNSELYGEPRMFGGHIRYHF